MGEQSSRTARGGGGVGARAGATTSRGREPRTPAAAGASAMASRSRIPKWEAGQKQKTDGFGFGEISSSELARNQSEAAFGSVGERD